MQLYQCHFMRDPFNYHVIFEYIGFDVVYILRYHIFNAHPSYNYNFEKLDMCDFEVFSFIT